MSTLRPSSGSTVEMGTRPKSNTQEDHEVTVSKFMSKYQGRVLEDAGSVQSEEFKQFARDFKSMAYEAAGNIGAKLYSFHRGHYDVSGFAERGGEYAYFAFSCPRCIRIDLTRSDCMSGILVRTAEGPKDFTGGPNNFTNAEGFQTLLDACLR